ncbi:hypothetical protein [Chryseobacterium sp.]
MVVILGCIFFLRKRIQ